MYSGTLEGGTEQLLDPCNVRSLAASRSTWELVQDVVTKGSNLVKIGQREVFGQTNEQHASDYMPVLPNYFVILGDGPKSHSKLSNFFVIAAFGCCRLYRPAQQMSLG